MKSFINQQGRREEAPLGPKDGVGLEGFLEEGVWGGDGRSCSEESERPIIKIEGPLRFLTPAL